MISRCLQTPKTPMAHHATRFPSANAASVCEWQCPWWWGRVSLVAGADTSVMYVGAATATH